MTTYSPESQRNFMIQWFKSWSEFQKEDFVTVLAQKLSAQEGVNGIIEGIEKLDTSGRPPSLFSCQVKLFNDWWATWGEADREKMTELFKEADLKFWETVEAEMKGTREKLNEDFMVVTVSTSDDDEIVSNGNGITINGTVVSPVPPPVFKVTQILTEDSGIQLKKEQNGSVGQESIEENLTPELTKENEVTVVSEQNQEVLETELDVSSNATAV